jgi:hypothetical protein
MSGKGGLFDEERHWVFVHIAKGFQGYAQNDIYGLNPGLVEIFSLIICFYLYSKPWVSVNLQFLIRVAKHAIKLTS